MMGWFLSSASWHWADSQVRERHMALTGVEGVCISDSSPVTWKLTLVFESVLQGRESEALESLGCGRWPLFHLGLARQGAPGTREVRRPRAAPHLSPEGL